MQGDHSSQPLFDKALWRDGVSEPYENRMAHASPCGICVCFLGAVPGYPHPQMSALKLTICTSPQYAGSYSTLPSEYIGVMAPPSGIRLYIQQIHNTPVQISSPLPFRQDHQTTAFESTLSTHHDHKYDLEGVQ